MFAVEVDSIEGALGGTNTATDTAVLVHNRRTATEAAGCLFLHLLFGQRAVVFLKLRLRRNDSRILTAAVIILLDEDILFVQFDEIAAVASDGHMTVLHIAMQALRRLFARCDGVDGELRSGEHISSHEDVGLGCLVGQFVCNRIDTAHELHFGIFEQVFENDGLADGEDNQVSL